MSERAGGADSDTLATGHAAALGHGNVEVKTDANGVPFAGAGDDIVVLNVIAGADASITEYAGLVIDGNHRRAVVLAAGSDRFAAAVRPREAFDVQVSGQGVEGIVPSGLFAAALRRLISEQEFGEHPPVVMNFRTIGHHGHAGLHGSNAGGGQCPLANINRA